MKRELCIQQVRIGKDEKIIRIRLIEEKEDDGTIVALINYDTSVDYAVTAIPVFPEVDSIILEKVNALDLEALSKFMDSSGADTMYISPSWIKG